MTDAKPFLTPFQIKDIRIKLGWSFEDMADALMLSADHGADLVRKYEADPRSARHKPITGPAAAAIMAFVHGYNTPPWEEWELEIENFLGEETENFDEN